MANLERCINSMVAKGLSEEKAREIVANVKRTADKMRQEGVSDNVQADMIKKIMADAELKRMEAVLKKKCVYKNIVVRKQIQSFITQAVGEGVSAVDALEALLVGSSKRFTGSKDSVNAQANTIEKLWAGSLLNKLEKKGLVDILKRDDDFSDLTMREMIEANSTGDPKAREAAQILSDTLEYMRVRMNEAGGTNIGKLEGYVPQNHDSLLIRKAGESTWVKYLFERLDFEKTFGDVHINDAKNILKDMYHTIVTGQAREKGIHSEEFRIKLPHNQYGQSNRFEYGRVLHFRNAATAIEYKNSYAQSNLMQCIINRIQRYSSSLALMDRFGTNPKSMIDSIIKEEMARATEANADKIIVMLKEAWSLEKGTSKILNRYLNVLDGTAGTAENLTVARISSNIRAVASMSKGGALLLSSFGDIGIKAASAKHGGVGWLESWGKGLEMRFQSLGSKEKVQLGRELGIYTDALIGEIYSRYDVNDNLSGKMSSLMNTFFKMNGLTAWTEAHKVAYTFSLSHRLAMQIKEGGNNLQLDYKAVLEKNNMLKYWDILSEMIHDVEGNSYITAESAYSLTDVDVLPYISDYIIEDSMKNPQVLENAIFREKERISYTVQSYYADELSYLVFESDAKTRVNRTQGHKARTGAGRRAEIGTRIGAGARAEAGTGRGREAGTGREAEIGIETGIGAEIEAGTKAGQTTMAEIGTGTGELLRFALQFKSFPITYWQRYVSEEGRNRASKIQRGGYGKALDRFTSDGMGITHFFLASMVLGYVSGVAKDIAKGREQRDSFKMETIFAAMIQGGGLTLLGDFLLGQSDGFENQDSENSTDFDTHMATDRRNLVGDLGHGNVESIGEIAQKPEIIEKIERTGIHNTSLINLSYTRAALDYMIQFRLREAMSTGILKQSEREMKEGFNQDYLMSDSDFTPSKHASIDNEISESNKVSESNEVSDIGDINDIS